MLVRRSTHNREVERLQTELRLTREENERQRVCLIQDLRDSFAQDIEGRVRGETREERRALKQHRDRFYRLIKVSQSFLPESRTDPTLPVFTEEEVLREIREILRELERDANPHTQMLTGGFIK